MTVTIYQPQYFPRLHYFNRILHADTFVILESAQYVKTLVHILDNSRSRHKSYQSDTVIKASSGVYFLTIPTKRGGLLPINKTVLDYSHKWQGNHLANIRVNYSKSSMFEKYFPEVKALLTTPYQSLAELNIKTMLWGITASLNLHLPLDQLTIECINKALKQTSFRLKRIVSDSELTTTRPEGQQKGTEWTTEICKELGATTYLHGYTAQSGYMNAAYYKRNGISLKVQDWKCLPYRQQHSKQGFLANLSILDLLFNEDQVTVQRTLGVL